MKIPVYARRVYDRKEAEGIGIKYPPHADPNELIDQLRKKVEPESTRFKLIYPTKTSGIFRDESDIFLGYYLREISNLAEMVHLLEINLEDLNHNHKRSISPLGNRLIVIDSLTDKERAKLEEQVRIAFAEEVLNVA